jgi:hypothetical protein
MYSGDSIHLCGKPARLNGGESSNSWHLALTRGHNQDKQTYFHSLNWLCHPGGITMEYHHFATVRSAPEQRSWQINLHKLAGYLIYFLAGLHYPNAQQVPRQICQRKNKRGNFLQTRCKHEQMIPSSVLPDPGTVSYLTLSYNTR